MIHWNWNMLGLNAPILINTTMRIHTKSHPPKSKTSKMSTASQITSSSHNLSLEAVMGEKIYRYMRGFQSIADRLRNQNMSKEDIQRLYNTVHSDWGPGCTYQYPKRHDKDAIKAFLDMCDKWYEEMDRTTDNLKYVYNLTMEIRTI